MSGRHRLALRTLIVCRADEIAHRAAQLDEPAPVGFVVLGPGRDQAPCGQPVMHAGLRGKLVKPRHKIGGIEKRLDPLELARRRAAAARSMPIFICIGLAPAATFLRPILTIDWASTVAVVVPSPATSSVLVAASLSSWAPMFSNGYLELDLAGPPSRRHGRPAVRRTSCRGRRCGPVH